MSEHAMQELMTAGTFPETIAAHPVVVVKFGSEDCPACRVYDEHVSTGMELFPQARFAKVDIDDPINSATPEARAMKKTVGHYDRIPFIAVFANGNLVYTQTGCMLAGLRSVLERLLAQHTERHTRSM